MKKNADKIAAALATMSTDFVEQSKALALALGRVGKTTMVKAEANAVAAMALLTIRSGK